MSEILEAAKAVIDLFDDNFSIADCEHVDRLRTAVERADKPPADFMVWWKTFPLNTYGIVPAFHGWEAGQQAERERIKKIITESREMKVIGKDWLLRQIDAGED